ncbi:MAG TPA: right-handed parallel beta-helix repeat-containing protein [Xanthomonadales bacterium]|nr:right-handed parallel beta-helix repeat-containing protein [Xanthomonadales bacterium]
MRIFPHDPIRSRRPARPRTLRGFRDQTVARALALAALLLACIALPAKADTFTVNRADDPAPPPACAPADCTLRAAIDAANANPGPDTIAFNIPTAVAGDVATIQVASPLPAITDDATTLDGYTQPDADAFPTPRREYDAVRLYLRRVGLERVPIGLDIRSNDNDVTGLALSHFDTAIAISGSGNTIRGNLLGIGPNGELEMPPSPLALWLRQLAAETRDNTIGTTALPNVLAGVDIGAYLEGVGGGTTPADENRIQANYFGIAPDGSSVMPLVIGVRVKDSTNVRIGQDNPPNGTRGNQIGGAGVDSLGIDIDASTRVFIDGNSLGAAVDAEIVRHPLQTGIEVSGASSDVLIEFNTLHSIRGNGIELDAGSPAPQRVLIGQNRILATGGLPIDLGGDGPTPNDPLDADAGPNGLLNGPATLTHTVNGDTVTVAGTLASSPNTNLFVDLFGVRHPGAAPAGGRGPIYSGMDYLFTDPNPVTTDANGNATFQVDLSRFELFDRYVPGAIVVDTTTGATSELARSTPTATELSTPSCVSFPTAFESNIDRPVGLEVEIMRYCNTSEAASVTVRSNGPGTTTPAIPPTGLVLSWAAGDASSRFITLVYNGPQTELTSWTLTLSNPVDTAIEPHASYELMLTQTFHEPWNFVDEIFGRPGRAGSMENPGRD